MIVYGFIMPDGREMKMSEDCRLHGELALKIIKEEYLYRQFRKTDFVDPVDFLVLEVGAIKVGNNATATTISVRVPYENDLVEEMVKSYKKSGLRIDMIPYTPQGIY